MGVEAIALDLVADVALDFSAEALGSVVTDLGTEFVTSSVGDLAFDVASSSLADFGAWDAVGSFAGDATWFDAFNPGDIVSSVPSVGDFSLGSIADSLPSVSSIKDALPPVSDFQGYIKTASQAINKVAPIARTVQNIAGYAGIQIPGTQILNQTAGLVNAANAGISTVSGISGTVGKVINSAEAVAGGERPATAIGGLLGAATPVNYSASEFTILNDQQTAALEKVVDPRFLNRFVPGTQSPQNYDAATVTIETLTPVVADLQLQVEGARLAISQENENIVNFQNQLDNPDLTTEERAAIEANIQNSYDNIAQAQQAIDNTEPLIISTSDQIAQATQLVASTDITTTRTAGAVPTASGALSPFQSIYNAARNTWSVINRTTGALVAGNLSAAEAANQIKSLNIASPALNLATSAGAVPGAVADNVLGNFATVDEQNAITQAQVVAARQQNAIRDIRQTKAQSSDWRVRLRLAPNSTYLYNTPNNLGGPGIMAALKRTDGVIFPYTPAVDTAYKANYEGYDLTHSNYRGYFYRNSYVDQINIRAQFTAQDTNEANYLLAVIHFFRSATKMFYGKDQQRGSPPPLVYLSGYGDYQFNEHPCVISQFNYQLPPDVDYIRCQSALDVNTNLLQNRIRNPIANNPLAYTANRLLNSNLLPGALDFRPSVANNLPMGSPTYVPTKMELSISLLPIQSRENVSKNFNVKDFANGNLLRAGYW